MARTNFGNKMEKILREHFEEPSCAHFGEVDIFSDTDDPEILKLRKECPSCKRAYEEHLKKAQNSSAL